MAIDPFTPGYACATQPSVGSMRRTSPTAVAVTTAAGQSAAPRGLGKAREVINADPAQEPDATPRRNAARCAALASPTTAALHEPSFLLRSHYQC